MEKVGKVKGKWREDRTKRWWGMGEEGRKEREKRDEG